MKVLGREYLLVFDFQMEKGGTCMEGSDENLQDDIFLYYSMK